MKRHFFRIGVMYALICFVATGCSDRGATAESQGTNSTAKPPSPNRKAQEKLTEAVNKSDLKAVEQALAAGAVPDAGAVTNDRPIAVATRLIGKSASSENIEGKLQVFAALCRNLRHRDRQITELKGKIEVTLVAMDTGQYYAKPFIKTSEGKSHQIEVTMRETTYQNTTPNDRILALRFDDGYRLRGSFADDKFEVEEMELLADAGKETSPDKQKKGMSIPVQSFFSSSGKFIQQFLPPDK